MLRVSEQSMNVRSLMFLWSGGVVLFSGCSTSAPPPISYRYEPAAPHGSTVVYEQTPGIVPPPQAPQPASAVQAVPVQPAPPPPAAVASPPPAPQQQVIVQEPPPQVVVQPQPSQVVVQAPPPAQVEIIPVAPAPGYTWVHGYWHWGGGGWVWMPGRWAFPPRPRAVWVPGMWVRERHGWRWHGGHWR